MELTIELEYDQILKIARQLPVNYKKRLSREIEKDLRSQKDRKTASDSRENESNDQDLNEFQQLLLRGPVMSDDQFENFKTLREDFNRWIER